MIIQLIFQSYEFASIISDTKKAGENIFAKLKDDMLAIWTWIFKYLHYRQVFCVWVYHQDWIAETLNCKGKIEIIFFFLIKISSHDTSQMINCQRENMIIYWWILKIFLMKKESRLEWPLFRFLFLVLIETSPKT